MNDHPTNHCFKAPNLYNESETITKFEIMDGAPVRGLYIQVHPVLWLFSFS